MFQSVQDYCFLQKPNFPLGTYFLIQNLDNYVLNTAIISPSSLVNITKLVSTYNSMYSRIYNLLIVAVYNCINDTYTMLSLMRFFVSKVSNFFWNICTLITSSPVVSLLSGYNEKRIEITKTFIKKAKLVANYVQTAI